MPSDPSCASGRTILIAARHGERKDYEMLAKGENWIKGADRPWDPPLSSLGWKQGAALGEHIKKSLESLDLPPVSQVYSSPFHRCRQTAVAANESFEYSPKVKVEYCLAESMNECWYRSWSLPTSNGTWGYKERDEVTGKALPVNLNTLHRGALQPAASIIAPGLPVQGIDLKRRSRTKINKVYCWGSFESGYDQRRRMRSIVNTVAKPGSTSLVVSHGGPVTHLYEELTRNDWWVHGEASYASFSIYERTPDGSWENLVMNESEHVPVL
jgi:broad specificity phosphatase PhoE